MDRRFVLQYYWERRFFKTKHSVIDSRCHFFHLSLLYDLWWFHWEKSQWSLDYTCDYWYGVTVPPPITILKVIFHCGSGGGWTLNEQQGWDPRCINQIDRANLLLLKPVIDIITLSFAWPPLSPRLRLFRLFQENHFSPFIMFGIST